MVTRLAILALAVALSGCISTRLSPPVLAALDCSQIIPPSFRTPIPGTPLPDTGATAGDLWKALDGQTTQLDQANGRISDLNAIADGCQARQQAVLAALDPPPWWQRLFAPKPKAPPH